MNSNDLVKFLTTEFMKYVNEPQDVRKKRKKTLKQIRAPWHRRLFGIMPQALALEFKNFFKLGKSFFTSNKNK